MFLWLFEFGKLDRYIFLIHSREAYGPTHCLTWYAQLKPFSILPLTLVDVVLPFPDPEDNGGFTPQPKCLSDSGGASPSTGDEKA